MIDTIPDVSTRAHDIYENVLRKHIETDDNIGKTLLLDVETGNYEIAESNIVANKRLRQRLPDVVPQSLYAFRIGYNAVYAIGGSITRTYSDSKPNKEITMTATLTEAREIVNRLSPVEQLKLAAIICEQVSREADSAQMLRQSKKGQRIAALACCDAVAEQIPREFDSAEDMRLMREKKENSLMNVPVAMPLLSKEEISRQGEELYANRLRAQVETEENIGKLIALDINTGAYEIDDHSLPAADRLRARFPDAVVYVLRIGYDAVYALGGTLKRTKQ